MSLEEREKLEKQLEEVKGLKKDAVEFEKYREAQILFNQEKKILGEILDLDKKK